MALTDEQLLAAIEEAATAAREETAQRDALIRQARERKLSLRRIAAAAGMSHGGVVRVIERA